jgi:hypothetical protein
VGLHRYAGHSFIIEVAPMRPLMDHTFFAKLVKLHRYAEGAPGIDLDVPQQLGEKYGKTEGQAEGRMVRAVKAYLDGKFDPDDVEEEGTA